MRGTISLHYTARRETEQWKLSVAMFSLSASPTFWISHDWEKLASVLRIIQSALNNTMRHSLANKAPVPAFTGLIADNPLRNIVREGILIERTPEFVDLQRKIHIDVFTKSLNEMHWEIEASSTRKRG